MKKNILIICLMLLSFAGFANNVLTPENWKPKVDKEAVINADRLDFDYELYIATFTGNVVINHPQFTAVADKIIIVFDKDAEENASVVNKKDSSILGKKMGDAQQRVKSAVAIGNVKAVGENILLTGDVVNYFKDNSMLRLTGKESPAVVQKDGRTISAQIITMWLNDNRIETSGGGIKLQRPASSTNLD